MTAGVEEVAGARSRPPQRRLSGRLSAGHLVMVTAALLAMVANYSILRARDDTVRVAVAAADLDVGAPLGAGSLDFVAVRVDGDVLDALVVPEDVDGIEGHVVSVPLAVGEPIRRSDLRSPSAIEEQRAMSVPIDPEHAVAGALVTGDRVDVIEVRDGVARYLLTDAQVLAVPDAPSAGGIAGLSRFSVTLAVDEGTALALAAAIRDGALEIVRAQAAGPVRPDAAAEDGR